MSKKKRIGLYLSAIVLVACIFMIIFFWQRSAAEPPIRPLTSVYFHYDYPVADSLEQMSAESDLIVTGRYTGLDSTWNMARDPADMRKEDPENYVEGRLYRFDVQEVWKGELEEDTILVNHKYLSVMKKEESNAVVNEEGIILSEATQTREISMTVHNPLFIEPTQDDTYILFLKQDPNFGNYYGAIEPFSIKVTDGKTELQSNLIDRTTYFTEEIPIGDNRTVHATIDAGVSIEDTISNKTMDEIKSRIAE